MTEAEQTQLPAATDLPHQEKDSAPRHSSKLGEELPVFCERCGYSLYGLAQIRCEQCTILQFHCPECGHHQPINTLRPAAQTLIGRIRGGWLAMVIFFKVNLIAWCLIGWGGLAAGFTSQFDWVEDNVHNHSANAPAFDLPSVLLFLLYGLAFGMVVRMALLRWKRGWAVGLTLAALVALAVVIGVWLERWDSHRGFVSAFRPQFVTLISIGILSVIVGASVIWPIWTILVHAFLPKRTAHVLLNWQRSLSNEVSALSRETSVGGV